MSDNPPTEPGPATRSLIVATAGHVDHGKSSLVNRITGIDTDTLAEEKARGLTINLGYAYHHFTCELENESCACTIGFVDVPGHTDFINNMLAGVGSVEFGLLVVAADDGIMPQTREHLAILDLLGISRGAVALTKIDRCEQQRVDEVSAEIRNLLGSTRLGAAPVFPVSNASGAGIDQLADYLREATRNKPPYDSRQEIHRFRFLIDRSFTVKGVGTVVTGSVRSGALAVGESVSHSGSGETARVRGIRLDRQDLGTVSAGQRAALNIAIDYRKIRRGDWLLDPDVLKPVNRLDCVVELIDPAYSLRENAEYHLYLGASHHIVTLRHLGDEAGRLYQLKSHDAIIACHGDRFIIRDPAAEYTVGGGRVIDIFVPPKKRSGEPRLKILEALDQDDAEALEALLLQQSEGVALDRFMINFNLSPARLESLQGELTEKAIAFETLHLEKRSAPLLLHERFFRAYGDVICKTLADYHRTQGHQQGLSEPALSRSVRFEGSHLLFHGILHRLIESGAIKRTGTLLHLPDHEAVLSQAEQDFLVKVRPLLQKAGYIPPRTRELVDLTGIPLKPLERILRETTKSGNLIQVADNRYYLPETIMELAEFTEQLADSGAGFSVIQFRDKSGIGRNLCIEILEYFDRVGFTRRDGNTRFVRTGKENIFGA